MSKLLALTAIFLSLLASVSCKSRSISVDNTIKIQGKLLYSPDNSVLEGGIINRASDGKAFVTDKSGIFEIEAQPGDSLHFSFVGTNVKS